VVEKKRGSRETGWEVKPARSSTGQLKKKGPGVPNENRGEDPHNDGGDNQKWSMRGVGRKVVNERNHYKKTQDN